MTWVLHALSKEGLTCDFTELNNSKQQNKQLIWQPVSKTEYSPLPLSNFQFVSFLIEACIGNSL